MPRDARNHWTGLVQCERRGGAPSPQPDDWVRLEIARALARNVRVVPVLVDGATLPKKNSLPEDIRSLVDRQSFTFTNPAAFRHEVAGLVRDIGGMTQQAKRLWRTAGI